MNDLHDDDDETREDELEHDSLTNADPFGAGIVDVHESDQDEDLGDEDEFTLETLSEAYADIVKQKPGDESGNPDDSAPAKLPIDATTPESDDPLSADAQDATSAVEQLVNSQADDDAACPVSPESIVEAMLFVGSPADVSLTGKKIAATLRDVSPKEVGQIVKKLNARYTKEEAAFHIDAKRGVYRMVLDSTLDSFQNTHFGRDREAKLAQSAIDVLAVVAYHQPATREEIDKVRGKPSGSVLSQLIKRELLSIETTADKPRRKVYSTTDRFLDLFGLPEIEDLPQSHEVADIEELAD